MKNYKQNYYITRDGFLFVTTNMSNVEIPILLA